LNLDTGACMGGKLTAAIFDDVQEAPLDFLFVGLEILKERSEDCDLQPPI
jgi:hypothetical protein